MSRQPRIRISSLLLLACLLGPALLAQETESTEPASPEAAGTEPASTEPASTETAASQRAAAHFQAERWSEAAAAYQEVVAGDDGDGEAWYRLAYSLRQLGRLDQAADAFRAALERGQASPQVYAGLAITEALRGEKDTAIAALARAVERGLPSRLLATEALTSLRDDPRFASLVKAAQWREHPCEHDPRYRALDFWVGDWLVRAGEQAVGRNVVTLRQRGCIVHESWTSAGGGRGESINYLDPVTGSWHQRWVDEGGNVVDYEGGPRADGAFHMTGTYRAATGVVTPARVTFRPLEDGSIHHLIEHSPDRGGSWQTYFEALYVPMPQDAGAAPAGGDG